MGFKGLVQALVMACVFPLATNANIKCSGNLRVYDHLTSANLGSRQEFFDFDHKLERDFRLWQEDKSLRKTLDRFGYRLSPLHSVPKMLLGFRAPHGAEAYLVSECRTQNALGTCGWSKDSEGKYGLRISIVRLSDVKEEDQKFAKALGLQTASETMGYVLFHEEIHRQQDISTPWGRYYSAYTQTEGHKKDLDRLLEANLWDLIGEDLENGLFSHNFYEGAHLLMEFQAHAYAPGRGVPKQKVFSAWRALVQELKQKIPSAQNLKKQIDIFIDALQESENGRIIYFFFMNENAKEAALNWLTRSHWK